MNDSMRELRPGSGVWYLTKPVWESEPNGAFSAAIWHYFEPTVSFRLSFKRADGRPLFWPDTGDLIDLRTGEVRDLCRLFWTALQEMEARIAREKAKPYMRLGLGIQIDED